MKRKERSNVNNQFWQDVARATDLVVRSGARRVDGEGFKVYMIPSGVTRIDISETAAREEAHDSAPTEA